MDNRYLNYTSKDYNSIYTDLVNAIPGITDLWTNTEDGDPGIVLVKLMSALGDMLSYNMDKQALEYYSSTVTQRKNAARLYNLIGYKMHWYISATNRIEVTNIVPIPNDFKAVITYQAWLVETDESKRNALEAQYEEQSNAFFNSHPYTTYPQFYTPVEVEGETTYERNYDVALNSDDPDSLYTYYNNNYETWRNDNSINIFNYLSSNEKNIGVYNNNTLSIPYMIIPSTASNVDATNNYLNAYSHIKPGDSQSFDVVQGTLNSINFNNNQLRNNRFYLPESAVDETYMWVSYESTFNNTQSTATVFIPKTDNLLTITDGEIYFEFNIDEFDNPYIELSSYWQTKLGQDSVNFVLYYVRTDGVYGNITKNYLNTLEGVSQSMYTITHPSNSTTIIDSNGDVIAHPGSHPQTTEQAYVDSINYVTTFNTLVTIYDFERFCKRHRGVTNTFAVDGQRAEDLNEEIGNTGGSMSLAQLQAYYNSSKQIEGDITNIDELQEIYMNHKKVLYNENDPEASYKNYGLNLHVVFEDFNTIIENNGTTYDIASLTLKKYVQNTDVYGLYWMYKLGDNYSVEPDDDSLRVNWVSYYLDKKIRETKIVNVVPEFASVRVFPWRCCGTIHLKAPVTEDVANSILTTVMSYLSNKFSPNNIEFGKNINYMDVINAVIDSHEMIQYFDAGLGNRKLIDIDESVDISYFNPTSLMYYVQTPDGLNKGSMYMYGNNTPYIDSAQTTPNPYYNILSIAPEYIIRL